MNKCVCRRLCVAFSIEERFDRSTFKSRQQHDADDDDDDDWDDNGQIANNKYKSICNQFFYIDSVYLNLRFVCFSLHECACLLYPCGHMQQPQHRMYFRIDFISIKRTT